MTLKNAALLALIGTILATVLLVWTFVFNFVNVLRGFGSSGNAVLVVHLCIRFLQRSGVLLRVPSSAIVTLARELLTVSGCRLVSMRRIPRHLTIGRVGRW